MTEKSEETWDVFVSHASEDKESFVSPLAAALSEFGVSVWYDEYTLRIGDSLSRSIDKGLAQSSYGLVVLSPNFIQKKWPEYELRGLVSREMIDGKVILPIWHNITKNDLVKFSPSLADKLAVDSSGLTPVQIAIMVIEVIRPEIFTRIQRRMAHFLAVADARTTKLVPENIKPSPIRHEELPPDLIRRIRLVRASLIGGYTHSMEFWMDGFKRDAHPSNEVSFWEHVAAVYREYCSMAPPLSEEQHKKIVGFILALDSCPNAEEIIRHSGDLPDGAVEILTNLYRYSVPAYDIEEPLPYQSIDALAKEFEDKLDKENFPDDLPDNLIRELMSTFERSKRGDS